MRAPSRKWRSKPESVPKLDKIKIKTPLAPRSFCLLVANITHDGHFTWMRPPNGFTFGNYFSVFFTNSQISDQAHNLFAQLRNRKSPQTFPAQTQRHYLFDPDGGTNCANHLALYYCRIFRSITARSPNENTLTQPPSE